MTPCVGVVLAAGAGTRLDPLTRLLPKPLCPVDNEALLDRVLGAVRPLVHRMAVNVHHHRDLLEAHLRGRDVHVSIEDAMALGTAGALANLREWIDGRPVVVANSDAVWGAPIDDLVRGWDGEKLRLLVVRDDQQADFDGVWRFAGASAMPWEMVRTLRAEPSGLYEACWRQALAAGRAELVELKAPFFDCGTPSEYLAANLWSNRGASVVGAGARVEGDIVRCVVWPDAAVERGENLVEVIRAPGSITVAAPLDRRFRALLPG